MAQDEIAIPIVFISDSKHAAMALADMEQVTAEYADQDDRQGIEDVITFLTQFSQGK